MTLTGGTLSAGTITTINLLGDWTNNGGVFTPGSSIVTFNNTTGAQNINGTAASQTFNGITVAKTAQTLSVGGNTNIYETDSGEALRLSQYLPGYLDSMVSGYSARVMVSGLKSVVPLTWPRFKSIRTNWAISSADDIKPPDGRFLSSNFAAVPYKPESRA